MSNQTSVGAVRRLPPFIAVLASLLWTLPDGASAQTKSRVIRWANLALVVRSDPATGVRLWVGSSLAARGVGASGTVRSARFTPADVREWVEVAQRFVTTPSDPTGAIATSPVLSGHDRQVLAVARDSAPPAGEPPLLLFFADSGGRNRLVARAPADGLAELFGGLALAAAEAGWNPDSVAAATVFSCAPLVDADCTPIEQPLDAKLRPPAVAMAGRGMVWAEYEVDEGGRVDLKTLDFIYSDHAALEGAIRRSLGRMVFTPATRHRKPIRQRVAQTFVFDFSGGPP